MFSLHFLASSSSSEILLLPAVIYCQGRYSGKRYVFYVDLGSFGVVEMYRRSGGSGQVQVVLGIGKWKIGLLQIALLQREIGWFYVCDWEVFVLLRVVAAIYRMQ